MKRCISVAAVLCCLSVVNTTAHSEESSPQTLADLIANRTANEARTGRMQFLLTNKRGQERRRTARMFHTDRNDATRVAIYFTAPANLEETAFLSVDAKHDDSDESWLYLPATERVRRLPSSDRGDYFMGTDLTYGDIKDNFKFSPSDWEFENCDQRLMRLPHLPCLQGVAKSNEIIRETGYSRFVAAIDTDTAFPIGIDYFDGQGQPLKQVTVSEQKQIGGAWTAIAFELKNHQSGHTTRIHFEEMRQLNDLSDDVFAADALEYGIPEI